MKTAKQVFELVAQKKMSFDEFELWFDQQCDYAAEHEYRAGYVDGIDAKEEADFF